MAAGSVAEKRRQIVGRVVAEEIAPAPVDDDVRPGAAGGHPAVAGDDGRDAGSLRELERAASGGTQRALSVGVQTT